MNTRKRTKPYKCTNNKPHKGYSKYHTKKGRKSVTYKRGGKIFTQEGGFFQNSVNLLRSISNEVTTISNGINGLPNRV
jgi:hypothetical protein